MLDLYLEGDFTKAVLEHKRAELEAQLAALRDERQVLVNRIAQTMITDEHIVSITELAAFVRDELDNADFALKRQLVEALNIWCTLAVEDGKWSMSTDMHIRIVCAQRAKMPAARYVLYAGDHPWLPHRTGHDGRHYTVHTDRG